jgi:hypothetical protein
MLGANVVTQEVTVIWAAAFADCQRQIRETVEVSGAGNAHS